MIYDFFRGLSFFQIRYVSGILNLVYFNTLLVIWCCY